MTTGEEWRGRVGQSWAATWRQTDRSFAPVTAALLDHPACRDYDRALDIGCGAGEITAALQAANPLAHATGVDVSPDLVAIARARCPSAHFVCADAATYRPEEAPDLIISRHGVMFFADPVGALSHLRREAQAGAILRFSCFRAREDNAWAVKLAEAVGAPPAEDDPRAPGPFAFGDGDYLAGLLAEAGWEESAITPLDYPMVAGEGPQAVDDALAYFARIGPAARTLAQRDGAARVDSLARLRDLLEGAHHGACVALPAAAWIVTARAPG